MAGLLDDFPIKFTCGKCTREFSKLVRDLKQEDQVVCPGCGDTAHLDEAGRKLLAAGEDEIARFIRSLKR